jgi:hypothetical protein
VNTYYESTSFGLDLLNPVTGQGVTGKIYPDYGSGGDIDASRYLETSPEMDAKIQKILSDLQGQTYPYGPNTCRDFSQGAFDEIAKALEKSGQGKRVAPPKRTIPMTPSQGSGSLSTTTRNVSSSGSSKK